MKVIILTIVISFITILNGCKVISEQIEEPVTESLNNKNKSQISERIDLITEPFIGWWKPDWSENSSELNVEYAQGKNTLLKVIHVGNSLDAFGVQIDSNETTHIEGGDIYGREQNVTIGTAAMFQGISVKPESIMADGMFIYPSGQGFDNSLFAHNFKVMVSYKYNNKGQLESGSGSEEISGHLSIPEEKILYSGNASGTFTIEHGQLAWKARTEKISYYYKDKLYAETVTAVTPQSEYLGGKLSLLKETIKTTTTYADGGKRESQITVLYQRNENGILESKTATGIVTEDNLINGKLINYSGTVNLKYSFDEEIGWYKAGYNEKSTDNTKLLKTLPFEIIFIDDLYLRPVF